MLQTRLAVLSCTLSAWTEITGTVAVAGQPLLLLHWAAHGCLVLVLPAWFWSSLSGSSAPCLVLVFPVWFWCSLPGSGAPCLAPAPPAWFWCFLPGSGPSPSLPPHLHLSLPSSGAPSPVPVPGGCCAWQAVPVHTL